MKKLKFLSLINCGYSVSKSSEMIGITRSTGYSWLRSLESHGIDEFLNPKRRGRPPKAFIDLSDIDVSKYTLSELSNEIKKRYNIVYSKRHLIRLKKILLKDKKNGDKNY
ncbi:helix-turn-helix domain-containing protein [Picrophilus oshimae]|nr:helix-turn-helix domain-containing protein [Picrophilus oshimae]